MRGAVINASFGENGYDIEVRFAEPISPHSVRIGAAWHPGSTDAFSGRLSWGSMQRSSQDKIGHISISSASRIDAMSLISVGVETSKDIQRYLAT